MPPAYSRLHVDERRRRLLELGSELFATHTYDELSMSRIAREAGISKALLYHYFPSKQAFFMATLQAAAGELERAIAEGQETLPPAEQLSAGLDAFLTWIEDNSVAYAKLIRSVQSVEEARVVVEAVRADTAARIVGGLAPGEDPPPPALRAAVRAWLWFMDGACLDWIEHRDLERDRLKGLLLGTLLGAVTAAGEGHRLARLAPA